MSRLKFNPTISNELRTCTFGSHPCGRLLRTSRARNANTRCVDPTSFNDRLLLGLKGTMSEAELHVLKARLRGGILNKVRRGEYGCPLPTGLVYGDAGNVVLDPEAQIREAIAYFFETFSRVGSASQAVKAFRAEGLGFPSRLRIGDGTVFRPLTASTAIRMLHNPRYAGAYAYGRRHYRRAVDGKKTINGRPYELVRASPPREGAALLKDAPSAVDAEGTSGFGMPHEEEGRKPGMSAIVATPLVASRTAGRLQDRQSTERLEYS